jgi:hypothetical protein
MRTMKKYIRKNGNGHANKDESTNCINESQLLVFKKSSRVFTLVKSFSLKSSNTSIPSFQAPTLVSRTSILEAPCGKDFPYT